MKGGLNDAAYHCVTHAQNLVQNQERGWDNGRFPVHISALEINLERQSNKEDFWHILYSSPRSCLLNLNKLPLSVLMVHYFIKAFPHSSPMGRFIFSNLCYKRILLRLVEYTQCKALCSSFFSLIPQMNRIRNLFFIFWDIQGIMCKPLWF